MSVRVASSAGFCFGVKRAVGIVEDLVQDGKKVFTLGPIIHNPYVVSQLQKKGVKIVKTPQEADIDGTIVIRSHGVPSRVMDEIGWLGREYVDATCPYVKKIHTVVGSIDSRDSILLVAGDRDHPEVSGIVGNCRSKSFVFDNLDQLMDIIAKEKEIKDSSVFVVAQTTFDASKWCECLEYIRQYYKNATIFDTICAATSQRQSEALGLSHYVDAMIVVGGRESSNTAKLRDICAVNTRTYLVESAQELSFGDFTGVKLIGITAGASTPACTIEEVTQKMSDFLDKAGTVNFEKDTELGFEEMLEESLKSLSTDEKVRGIVVGIAPNEVYVDVGRKQAGFIPFAEFTADPNAKLEDLVKVGDELDLLIMRTNDQEGTIMLSKRRLDSVKGWDEIEIALEEHIALEGPVVDIVKGGVIAIANAVRVFIPASQASIFKSEPLEDLKNKKVRFYIIEVNRQKRKAVGSVRALLNEERGKQEEKFWQTAKVGAAYTGEVKSFTSYGAFVDIGGIDGMVHVSELSWDKVRHPEDMLKIGQKVDVIIKDLDKEKNKVSLTYKRIEDNPWEIMKNNYAVGSVIDVEIVGMTAFGAFGKIRPGIDGLIHISQISNNRIEKPQDVLSIGEIVKVKIMEIDYDKKKISLSIRALLEEANMEPERSTGASEENLEPVKELPVE